LFIYGCRDFVGCVGLLGTLAVPVGEGGGNLVHGCTPICVGAGVTGVHILPVRHPYPLPPAVAPTDHCRRSASQYLFLVMMPTRERRCLRSKRQKLFAKNFAKLNSCYHPMLVNPNCPMLSNINPHYHSALSSNVTIPCYHPYHHPI
jgi:hypothetical protein